MLNHVHSHFIKRCCGLLFQRNRKLVNTTIEASSYLTPILSKYTNGCFFAGITQYYEKEDYDNLLMFHFQRDFISDKKLSLYESESVLDCTLLYSDVDPFMKQIKEISQLPVYNGEVDVVNNMFWEFAFTLHPFTIFSEKERLCYVQGDSLILSKDGTLRTINALDVEYVGFYVSKMPFNNREMFISLKGGEKVTILSMEKYYVDCDLAMIAMETEWHMKASALLCIHLTKLGNTNVHLKVSPVLQPLNNEYVAQRQKLWNDMIQRMTWEKDL